jgi:hypothetical protein
MTLMKSRRFMFHSTSQEGIVTAKAGSLEGA